MTCRTKWEGYRTLHEVGSALLASSNMSDQQEPQLTDEQILEFEQQIKDEEALKVKRATGRDSKSQWSLYVLTSRIDPACVPGGAHLEIGARVQGK